MVYGLSNLLILIFIFVQAAIIIAVVRKTLKFVSNRILLQSNTKGGKNYMLGGCLGYFGGVILSRVTEGVDNDVSRIITAACFMVGATVSWISIVLFFQLYYAAKYKIEIINTWDAKV